ncbi:histidine phosphatase family protein [Mycobacterium colombiense]|uniref:histidine phosphatase family protein n=1 Tax=Mycobacterium colombiense TaxID=339268 RepID=UPI00096E79C2|nr:histidine phosphatase family protein [Mycobacterium colombiense]OMB93590.1 phosphoglycerate mutase [Mycobacterium colombiense]
MPASGIDRVYLARHGRTALNADGRLRGLSDPPLDDVGQAEAKRLGEALAAFRPTVVISSPLQRAVSTGEAIGAASHVRVEVDQRLNDRDYGPWTGQPRAEVEQRFGSVDAAPGVEPADAVAARALAAFIELADEYRDGPLVMVSHDAFNTALLRMLDPALEGIEQRTACYNQLSRSGAGWRVDFYDRKPE